MHPATRRLSVLAGQVAVLSAHPASCPVGPAKEREISSAMREKHEQAEMTYSQYLQLEKLLSAQGPAQVPPAHDEVLFIVMHQAAELWMKLIQHELLEAVGCLRADSVHQVSKILARVKMIMNVLNQQWPVLATMTPNEFNAFRPALGSSSGFQSAGYRAIEFLLGNKSHAMVSYHQHSQEATDQLKEILHKPSLYDEFLAYLGRQGLRIPEEVLRRDVTVAWTSHPDVVEAARQVYADKEKYWGAYELAEKLVDLDESVSMWRFRHLTTVSRTIGFKSGTGGSSGVGFLNEFVSRRFFPELWEVRTALV